MATLRKKKTTKAKPKTDWLGRVIAETPRHKWTGVLIGSPTVAFAFGIIASQFGAVSGRPSVGRASCSNGTYPFIR